jgi:hypothetical protein
MEFITKNIGLYVQTAYRYITYGVNMCSTYGVLSNYVGRDYFKYNESVSIKSLHMFRFLEILLHDYCKFHTT